MKLQFKSGRAHQTLSTAPCSREVPGFRTSVFVLHVCSSPSDDPFTADGMTWMLRWGSCPSSPPYPVPSDTDDPVHVLPVHGLEGRPVLGRFSERFPYASPVFRLSFVSIRPFSPSGGGCGQGLRTIEDGAAVHPAVAHAQAPLLRTAPCRLGASHRSGTGLRDNRGSVSPRPWAGDVGDPLCGVTGSERSPLTRSR